MMKTLLVRGMLAGLIAGVLATGFAYLFGEPSVNAAIGLEESGGGHSHSAPAEPGAHSHEAEPEEELVSRDVQSTLGLFTGVAGYGVAIGGLFSLGFAFAHGRLGPMRPRATAAVLAAAGYVVVVLVPFLKYPANPPAVGQAGTIGDRTGLYFAFVAISLVVAGFAVAAGRTLTQRFGAWGGFLLGAGGYVVVMALCAWLLPVIDEVPEGFPGSTLWTFRTASIGTQLVLWTALGLVFGALAEKVAPKRAVATV